MPRLILIRGADEGRQFELNEPLHAVGRDAGSGIRLHDTEVSRRHAEFRLANGAYYLVDVGSANGTYVNGQPIQNVLLQPGDRIQIGQSVLVYSAGRGDSTPAGDLADRINLIARQDGELSSAIVKSVADSEGSRILAQPEQARGPWLKNALANLGVMYETIQAVSHIMDVHQLMERIMDLIFRSIEADRGCVMIHDPDSGDLEPRAVRWRRPGPQGKMAVSSTIVDYVLRERKGVLVSDAARDERFDPGNSIIRNNIREVICVPMKGRHETIGVLYLDTVSTTREAVERRNPTGRFSEEQLSLAIAIAHQAALAVEETRYYQAMVQAERLAAIGQTIAGLSHHIKNILQGLHTGSDIVNMGLKDGDTPMLTKGWRIVERNQAKISELVMDMLQYSKDREPELEVEDLNNLARDVLETVAGRVGAQGVRVETRFDDLPAAAVDPAGIHRALLNVVTNALDALEDQPDPRLGLATYVETDGAWVRVLVQDNGPGIPPERQKEIFRPFVSTKGSRGTGLGLAVSRKILREHGGDILLNSQPGKGCRFMLRIPLRSISETGSEEFAALPPGN